MMKYILAALITLYIFGVINYLIFIICWIISKIDEKYENF
jgi:hypothetical protein